jgi:hypothetical protein
LVAVVAVVGVEVVEVLTPCQVGRITISNTLLIHTTLYLNTTNTHITNHHHRFLTALCH